MRPSRSMVTPECSQPPVGQRRRGAEAAHLDVHRQAEADEPALRLRRIALGLELGPLRVLQREVQALLVVARVVDRAHLRRKRKLVRLDEVLAAQLGRIHLQLARQHVHGPLDEVGRFRTAGAAIRVGRRLVGEDLRQRDADRRDLVGRIRHQHRERRDGRGQQHVVGADVGDQAQLQARARCRRAWRRGRCSRGCRGRGWWRRTLRSDPRPT